MSAPYPLRTAVVIPCYRVLHQILRVLAAVPPDVAGIICVDDACPENSGDHISQNVTDPRVVILRHDRNLGVGGALLSGYRLALEKGFDLIVKVDGDGQMDPRLIPLLTHPIVTGLADYTKGNRFFQLEFLARMPRTRLIGNALLSFVAKISTGYWDVMDPHNGFTAIHASVLRLLPLDKIEQRYFFEVDMLSRLSHVRARVLDVPMIAVYGDEQSSLRIPVTLLRFPGKYVSRFFKRVVYSYFLRDFNVGTVQFLTGFGLAGFGFGFGIRTWLRNEAAGLPTPAGTVMVAALPALIGVQLLLSALLFDVARTPTVTLHPLLAPPPKNLDA